MPSPRLITLTVAAALAWLGTDVSRAAASDGERQLAKQSLLTLQDLPSGWRAAKQPEDRVKCPAFTAARRAATGAADAPRFLDGDLAEVGASVYRFADEAAAKRAFRAITGRATRRCYRDQVVKTLKDNDVDEVRAVRIRGLRLQAGLGDQRAGTRFVFPLTTAGVDLDLYVDLTYVRSGRAISLMLLLRASGPFDSGLRNDLVTRQAERLAA